MDFAKLRTSLSDALRSRGCRLTDFAEFRHDGGGVFVEAEVNGETASVIARALAVETDVHRVPEKFGGDGFRVALDSDVGGKLKHVSFTVSPDDQDELLSELGETR